MCMNCAICIRMGRASIVRRLRVQRGDALDVTVQGRVDQIKHLLVGARVPVLIRKVGEVVEALLDHRAHIGRNDVVTTYNVICYGYAPQTPLLCAAFV